MSAGPNDSTMVVIPHTLSHMHTHTVTHAHRHHTGEQSVALESHTSFCWSAEWLHFPWRWKEVPPCLLYQPGWDGNTTKASVFPAGLSSTRVNRNVCKYWAWAVKFWRHLLSWMFFGGWSKSWEASQMYYLMQNKKNVYSTFLNKHHKVPHNNNQHTKYK